MLKTVGLHNFRSYLSTTINLTRRHLLIGKNNSGKTNLARALKFLSVAATSDPAQAAIFLPGGPREMRSWNIKQGPVELSCNCELEFEGEKCEFRYEIDVDIASVPTGQTDLRIKREMLSAVSASFLRSVLLSNDGHEAVMLHESNHQESREPRSVKTLSPRDGTMLSKLYELDTNKRAILFRRFLSEWAYYSFNPDLIRNGWQQQGNGYALACSGENLAYVIYQLKNQDELRYRRLIEHAKILEPDLVAINFVPAPGQAPVPFVALSHQPRASWMGLSDGTLRTLAIAAIIETTGARHDLIPSIAPMCIIEEPENGIAPAYLRRIFDLFEERSPSSQFIFTSHSPYFIDLFDGYRDSVTVLRKTADHTEIGQPSPPAIEQGPDRLTLSEEYATELVG